MKKRLDLLVCELSPELSRQKARAAIMSGFVYVNGQKELKSGSMFAEDAVVEIRGQLPKYVSRGGLKLEKAVDCFSLELNGKICMDIGSSTGGFTDCMLQNGAAKVYAVDVGYGQLHYKLRNDDRVVVLEKTNIRHLDPGSLDEVIDIASIDVSFISLGIVMPKALEFFGIKKELVMLIKPQFEAGREKVGKKGVVRDADVHIEVIEKITKLVYDNNLSTAGLTYSPVRGPEGNIEYLIHAVGGDRELTIPGKDEIAAVVNEAHRELAG